MLRSGRRTQRSVASLIFAFGWVSYLLSWIFIKDVKSSNGTFVNGERLSPGAEESKPYELKSDDIVVSPYYIFVFLFFSLLVRNSELISSAKTRQLDITKSPHASSACSQNKTLLSPHPQNNISSTGFNSRRT
jgi:pSer/pThr/pTyr-binding forkhead associated (FHA) protein